MIEQVIENIRQKSDLAQFEDSIPNAIRLSDLIAIEENAKFKRNQNYLLSDYSLELCFYLSYTAKEFKKKKDEGGYYFFKDCLYYIYNHFEDFIFLRETKTNSFFEMLAKKYSLQKIQSFISELDQIDKFILDEISVRTKDPINRNIRHYWGNGLVSLSFYFKQMQEYFENNQSQIEVEK